MADGSKADESDVPKPSVSLFDPVAGMRAVADIQAEGLRAATELLERMLGSEPDGHGARTRPIADGYAALVDAWTELLRRTVDGLTAPRGPDAVTAAVDAHGVGPQVRLALRASGNDATEVWVRNGTFAALGPLTLRCGQLSDSGGTVLAGAEVRFEPPELSVLPPRSSRAVVVSVAATGPLRPGIYRGAIQAHGAPALWLPLEVMIDPC